MLLSTPVAIESAPFKLGYAHRTLVVGSCFATNMGERLQRLKFPVTINPFGVVYNPASIANSLQQLLEGRVLNPADLHFANGCWFSFNHHGSFSSPDRDVALAQMNSAIQQGAEALRSLDVLILTLGTARVYLHKQSGQVVANCHKQPASEFTHRLMSVDEVYSCLHDMLTRLQQLIPELKTIITVSPIRHTKDGAHGNQLSKATLLLAADRLCQTHKNTYYFPAYELMMDELRDYRFYADDMLHPSPVAVEYIWQRFAEAAIEPEAQRIAAEVEKLLAAKQHRPFNTDTAEHAAFLASFYKRTSDLLQRYPYLNLSDELRYFNQK